MSARIPFLAAVLACAGLVWAGQADDSAEPMNEAAPAQVETAPEPAEAGTEPDQQTPDEAIPDRPPVTQEEAVPGPAERFPTPQELIQRMREMRTQEDQLLKVAYLDLSGRIIEKPADFSLFGDPGGVTLRSVLDRLQSAQADSDVRAVLLSLNGARFNLAQAQEIRDSLAELRRAGKRTFVYADRYDTAAYTVASAATNICLLEGGEIVIPGVGIEAMFVKGLLEKIGVQGDFVQIGEYKGADEQFTRTGASEELRGELNRLMDALYDQIVDGISLHRNLPRSTVQQMIDEAMITGRVARDRGFVDHLVDMDRLRSLMTEELGGQINLVHEYGKPRGEAMDMSNPFALFAMLARRPEVSTKPAIAVIYAEGMIVDGAGGTGLFGSAVGSEDLRKALRIALRDDRVKAVVIRVDSPGGSALASEVAWQAVRRVAETKPVVVSIGSMAASGGYYIASAGDRIFADPTAIVGSIGVVGGKFVVEGLYEKLGLTTEAFHRGRNADLFSSSQPFNDRQRRMITTWMKQTYDQFTDRIMATRGEKIGDIDRVARGRIFIAQQARELGMVDEIGGMTDALAYAAKQAELDEYDVRVLPAPRTLADLFGAGETHLPLRPTVSIGDGSLLGLLTPAMRQRLGQQILMMQMLEQRPVMLVTPYTIIVR